MLIYSISYFLLNKIIEEKLEKIKKLLVTEKYIKLNYFYNLRTL